MSDCLAGIESLDYSFPGHKPVGVFTPVLVGVVGSGNLEVMLEPDIGDRCDLHIETSARGYGVIWDAVVRDFHDRHRMAGMRISINDMGATPAVVRLRLDQAVAELMP